MKKESVVVFKGEDKFILPRNKVYNMKSGKAEFVGQDGVKDAGVTPPTATDPRPAPPNKDIIVEDPDKGENPPKQYGYSSGKFQMPDPTNPEFCGIVQEYISSRGQGSASPEEVMSAYNAFRKYCVSEPTPPYGGEQPPKDKPSDDTKPKDDKPKDGDVNMKDKLREIKPEIPTPPKQDVVIPALVSTPLITPDLGMPLGGRGGAGGGGGGGEEEAKPQEKKKSYWWLLIVAAGIGAYIYYKRKK